MECSQAAASNSEKSLKGSNNETKPKVLIKCKDKVKVINEKANPEDEVNIFLYYVIIVLMFSFLIIIKKKNKQQIHI